MCSAYAPTVCMFLVSFKWSAEKGTEFKLLEHGKVNRLTHKNIKNHLFGGSSGTEHLFLAFLFVIFSRFMQLALMSGYYSLWCSVCSLRWKLLRHACHFPSQRSAYLYWKHCAHSLFTFEIWDSNLRRVALQCTRICTVHTHTAWLWSTNTKYALPLSFSLTLPHAICFLAKRVCGDALVESTAKADEYFSMK